MTVASIPHIQRLSRYFSLKKLGPRPNCEAMPLFPSDTSPSSTGGVDPDHIAQQISHMFGKQSFLLTDLQVLGFCQVWSDPSGPAERGGQCRCRLPEDRRWPRGVSHSVNAHWIWRRRFASLGSLAPSRPFAFKRSGVSACLLRQGRSPQPLQQCSSCAAALLMPNSVGVRRFTSGQVSTAHHRHLLPCARPLKGSERR